jgi:hypothetical protein
VASTELKLEAVDETVAPGINGFEEQILLAVLQTRYVKEIYAIKIFCHRK